LIEHENGAIVNTVEGGELVMLTIPAGTKTETEVDQGFAGRWHASTILIG